MAYLLEEKGFADKVNACDKVCFVFFAIKLDLTASTFNRKEVRLLLSPTNVLMQILCDFLNAGVQNVLMPYAELYYVLWILQQLFLLERV